MAFFPSWKQNFIAYRSSKVSDCIFGIHQLWQSGFSRMHSNCCCSCWFEAEIVKMCQSSHKMYSNNILNFQESTTILDASTKKKICELIEGTMYVRDSSLILLYSQSLSAWAVDLLQYAFLTDSIKISFRFLTAWHIRCYQRYLWKSETLKANHIYG